MVQKPFHLNRVAIGVAVTLALSCAIPSFGGDSKPGTATKPQEQPSTVSPFWHGARQWMGNQVSSATTARPKVDEPEIEAIELRKLAEKHKVQDKKQLSRLVEEFRKASTEDKDSKAEALYYFLKQYPQLLSELKSEGKWDLKKISLVFGSSEVDTIALIEVMKKLEPQPAAPPAAESPPAADAEGPPPDDVSGEGARASQSVTPDVGRTAEELRDTRSRRREEDALKDAQAQFEDLIRQAQLRDTLRAAAVNTDPQQAQLPFPQMPFMPQGGNFGGMGPMPPPDYPPPATFPQMAAFPALPMMPPVQMPVLPPLQPLPPGPSMADFAQIIQRIMEGVNQRFQAMMTMMATMSNQLLVAIQQARPPMLAITPRPYQPYGVVNPLGVNIPASVGALPVANRVSSAQVASASSSDTVGRGPLGRSPSRSFIPGRSIR